MSEVVPPMPEGVAIFEVVQPMSEGVTVSEVVRIMIENVSVDKAASVIDTVSLGEKPAVGGMSIEVLIPSGDVISTEDVITSGGISAGVSELGTGVMSVPGEIVTEYRGASIERSVFT